MSRDQQAILPSTVTWIPDPHEVTNWLVEFRSNTTRHCPLGYVCNQTHQASCTEIRLLSIAYGFGDVHAGGWCPEGRNQLLLCPVGHYCPTAEEIHLCPSKNHHWKAKLNL